jgi:hypothetical protein
MLSRLAVLLHLVLLGACLLFGLAEDCRAQGRRGPASAVSSGRAVRDELSFTVEGLGVDEAFARKEAATKARDRIIEYLRRQDPPITWTPSIDYIQQRFMRDPQRLPEKDVPSVSKVGKLPAKCWSWTVTVGARELQEIDRLQQEEAVRRYNDQRAGVIRERLELLTRGLAIIVVGLLAVMAYIRLDDWTKGYYSRRLALGLGAVALLVLAAVFIR